MHPYRPTSIQESSRSLTDGAPLNLVDLGLTTTAGTSRTPTVTRLTAAGLI
jgi:hypothetical protein